MVISLLAAVLLDLIIGDPKFIPHPVIIIGKLISLLEKGLRGLVKGNKGERLAGIILVLVVVISTYFFTYYILELASMVNYYVGFGLNIWLLATTIAIKGLVNAGFKVYKNLLAGDIDSARKAVGQIVGRDTENMKKKGMIRATVETLAENSSDGIIAPIFFYILGGVPLAMTYKAINTLDSMLGYKNERYYFFGWAAARLDDLANLIPARLTGIGFCLVAFLMGKKGGRAFSIMFRDAVKHPSPNAGYPEGAIAGALGIRLGGVNYYHGKPSFRAYLGNKLRDLELGDITEVIKMIYWNVGLIISIFILFSIF